MITWQGDNNELGIAKFLNEGPQGSYHINLQWSHLTSTSIWSKNPQHLIYPTFSQNLSQKLRKPTKGFLYILLVCEGLRKWEVIALIHKWSKLTTIIHRFPFYLMMQSCRSRKYYRSTVFKVVKGYVKVVFKKIDWVF